MSTIQDDLLYIKERLSDRNLSRVAEKTNLSVSTVKSFRDGVVKRPSHRAFTALLIYLRGNP